MDSSSYKSDSPKVSDIESVTSLSDIDMEVPLMPLTAAEHSSPASHLLEVMIKEEDKEVITLTPEEIEAREREEKRRKYEMLKEFKCEVCGKHFHRSADLRRHSVCHSGLRPFVCGVCGKGFAQKPHLATHSLLHGERKPYPCPVCDKGYTQKQKLDSHIKIIHEQSRPYTCSLCGKTFARPDTYKLHMKRHDGYRPFACHLCQRTFTQSYHYKNHMDVHANVNPNICVLCDKSFSDRGSLNRHRRKVHKIMRNIPTKSELEADLHRAGQNVAGISGSSIENPTSGIPTLLFGIDAGILTHHVGISTLAGKIALVERKNVERRNLGEGENASSVGESVLAREYLKSGISDEMNDIEEDSNSLDRCEVSIIEGESKRNSERCEASNRSTHVGGPSTGRTKIPGEINTRNVNLSEVSISRAKSVCEVSIRNVNLCEAGTSRSSEACEVSHKSKRTPRLDSSALHMHKVGQILEKAAGTAKVASHTSVLNSNSKTVKNIFRADLSNSRPHSGLGKINSHVNSDLILPNAVESQSVPDCIESENSNSYERPVGYKSLKPQSLGGTSKSAIDGKRIVSGSDKSEILVEKPLSFGSARSISPSSDSVESKIDTESLDKPPLSYDSLKPMSPSTSTAVDSTEAVEKPLSYGSLKPMSPSSGVFDGETSEDAMCTLPYFAYERVNYGSTEPQGSSTLSDYLTQILASCRR